MASWRTVHGHIERLDQWLVSDEDVQAFFEEQRILGRGASDGKGGFDFEVAVAGRRRRVATLDEAGTVFRGRSVTELVDVMRESLRKVEVELDGEIAHGPIDLGAVDVSDEELIADPPEADEPADSDNAVGAGDTDGTGDAGDVVGTGDAGELGGSMAEEAEQPEEHKGPEGHEGREGSDEAEWAEVFERESPMLVIVDLPLSEVPSLVAAADVPVAASKLGSALVLTAEKPLLSARKLFPRPSYQIVLSAAEDSPLLYVRRDNQCSTWNWDGEMPVFPWIEPGSEGHDFVVDETGAGAVARRAVADVIDARFADIRCALQASPQTAVRSLVAALNLPEEIVDVLEGRRGLAEIPNSQLFTPGSGGSAFQDRLAFEIAGEGFVEPDLMGAYRKIYLERPWAVAVASAVQTAVAGGMLTAGFNRANAGRPWKLLTALGGWALVGGVARILTTSYAQSLVTQRQSDIETWKMMRNLQDQTAGQEPSAGPGRAED
ncbi:ICP22 family protein [Trueperella bialowiezensis]|uniref:Uncharacterized protein n=1 Tax=Trueperella bialowiezensis TaxID=312285 RepID=A0A3S4WG49_9ACTO|nr:hypothetical protein [Trueperella bialowiezensis]VEI13125.1 Uncharacterised protein [Trueperella bialowiezensis]